MNLSIRFYIHKNMVNRHNKPFHFLYIHSQHVITKKQGHNKQNAKHIYKERQIHSPNFTLVRASGHLTFVQKLTASRILTKNYTHPLCDWPCRLNGVLQSFGVPKIRVLAFEKQDNKTHIQTKQKHRFLKIVVGYFRDL